MKVFSKRKLTYRFLLICTVCFYASNILGQITVSGFVRTADGIPLNNVPVLVNNGDFETMTTPDGYFSFDLFPGGDYTIKPVYDENYNHELAMTDMLILVYHILGIEFQADPYVLIAGDMSNNCTLTTLDLVYLKKAILGFPDPFPFQDSWVFVDADFVLPPGQTPCDYPTVININDLSEDMFDLEFIGVKIGDLNGSATSLE